MAFEKEDSKGSGGQGICNTERKIREASQDWIKNSFIYSSLGFIKKKVPYNLENKEDLLFLK